MGDHKAQNRDGCWVFILFTLFYVFVFVFFFLFSLAVPIACGSSQARYQSRGIAATLTP